MGFVKEIRVGIKSSLSPEAKKKASEAVETARKIDSKLVKGIFKNLESPGGDLQFAYHKYKGEPTRVYNFIDGESYTIPLGVAKHINNQCKYKKCKHLVDQNGKPVIAADKPIERYQFVSTDFM